MINKVKSLKISDVVICMFVAGMFYILLVAKRAGPDNMKELIAQREPWLKQITQEIAEYMNDDNAEVWTVSTGGRYVSSFSFPSYSIKKLNGLKNNFVQQGWYLLDPEQYVDKSEDLDVLLGMSSDNTYMLCKDGAALIIWRDNLKEKYDFTTDTGMKIDLWYSYQTPCFDFRKEESL